MVRRYAVRQFFDRRTLGELCNKNLSHFVISAALCNNSLSHFVIPDARDKIMSHLAINFFPFL